MSSHSSFYRALSVRLLIGVFLAIAIWANVLLTQGAFFESGLPQEMLGARKSAATVLVGGWGLALVWSFTDEEGLVGLICLILAGMFSFDFVTTLQLDFPQPFNSILFGIVVLVSQVFCGAYILYTRTSKATALEISGFRRFLWATLFLVLSYLFAESAHSVWLGYFDDTGLPQIVLPGHVIMNATEAVVWLAAAALVFVKRPSLAASFAALGSGMWCWDMMTTASLSMPVWPYYTTWGVLFVIVMIFGAFDLVSQRRSSVAT